MKLTRILILFLILLPVSLTAAYIVFPLDPLYEQTGSYQKKFTVVPQYPFLMKYYLLEPVEYDPRYSYPLVLVLHGATRHSYPGYVAAVPELRERHPAIIVVPIAPIKSYWATPYAEATMGGLFSALPHAVSLIDKVKKSYTVDPGRIYVIGNSMGGFGAFGALAKYPHVFAAGIPACGGWTPADAKVLAKKALWAFHSQDDDAIPVIYTKAVMGVLPRDNKRILYTEYQNAGHGCQMEAFSDYLTWDWLFYQKL